MNARPSLNGSRWSQRTPDECFDTVDDLRVHLQARRAHAEVRRVPLWALRPVASDDGVRLSLDGAELAVTPWAAARFSDAVGLPARAVQALSPGLATAALEERRSRVELESPDREVEIVVDRRDGYPPRLRSLVSVAYARVWDADLVEAFLEPLAARGWRPAASRRPGGHPMSGLFSSDRDLYCFLIHEDRPLRLDGVHPRPLLRGLILRNSEVGGVALRVQTFWFDGWCTNHMIFGAREVVDLRESHRHGGDGPLARLEAAWRDWGGFSRLDSPPLAAEAVAASAAQTALAPLRGGRREVIEEAVTRTRLLAARARAGSVLRVPLLRDAAARALESYRAPGSAHLSLWEMASGLTETAWQRTGYASERHRVDDAVGRLLEVSHRLGADAR